MVVLIVILQELFVLLVEVISKHQFLASVMKTPLISVTYMDRLINASTVSQHTNFKQMYARKTTLGVLWVDLMVHALNVDFLNYSKEPNAQE